MRWIAIFSLLLLLAACGSNAANNSEVVWLPKFTTPEDALEVYARAIESGDVELAASCVARDEREAYEPVLRGQFRQSKELGLRWKIEAVKDSAQSDDKFARVQVRYVPVDEDGKFKPQKNNKGEDAPVQTSWLVFLKQADNTWRHSPIKSRELNMPPEQPQPPGNSPD